MKIIFQRTAYLESTRKQSIRKYVYDVRVEAPSTPLPKEIPTVLMKKIGKLSKATIVSSVASRDDNEARGKPLAKVL